MVLSHGLPTTVGSGKALHTLLVLTGDDAGDRGEDVLCSFMKGFVAAPRLVALTEQKAR